MNERNFLIFLFIFCLLSLLDVASGEVVYGFPRVKCLYDAVEFEEFDNGNMLARFFTVELEGDWVQTRSQPWEDTKYWVIDFGDSVREHGLSEELNARNREYADGLYCKVLID